MIYEKRTCGILLHISSLPSPYGIGTFGKEAYEFIDFLAKCGQSCWQILPLSPISYGDSPYQSPCSIAGNPYFIDLNMLAEEGLLSKGDLNDISVTSGKVDYGYLWQTRLQLLRKAYRSFSRQDSDFLNFLNIYGDLIRDFSVYMAAKEANYHKSWCYWVEELKAAKNLDAFIKDHSYDIGFWEFVQYKFFTQWFSLRRYALTKGIKIIGDMPIYVAYDSADVWLNKGLFLLGKNFLPLKVAGVPPDLFSESGQLWGNPLYDWSAMEKNGFDWWLRRFRFNSIMYDILRIDHFRGFASFYAVDYGRKDAVIGSWMDAPGEKLFELVSDKFPDLEIIAEDLGYITPDVENLLRKTGFPGMRVLQFGFDCNTDNPHHPDNYPYNCFAYTGTHDNQTTFAWYKDTDNKQREEIRRYTNETDPDRITDALIKAVLDSRAKTAIIPMQDYMRLGDEARMNTPSTVTGNWTWRLKEDYADDLLTDRILHMAVNSGRTLEK